MGKFKSVFPTRWDNDDFGIDAFQKQIRTWISAAVVRGKQNGTFQCGAIELDQFFFRSGPDITGKQEGYFSHFYLDDQRVIIRIAPLVFLSFLKKINGWVKHLQPDSIYFMQAGQIFEFRWWNF